MKYGYNNFFKQSQLAAKRREKKEHLQNQELDSLHFHVRLVILPRLHGQVHILHVVHAAEFTSTGKKDSKFTMTLDA